MSISLIPKSKKGMKVFVEQTTRYIEGFMEGYDNGYSDKEQSKPHAFRTEAQRKALVKKLKSLSYNTPNK